MADKTKKDMDIARKIWLAGIGAYGRAFDDAQEAYAKVGMGTTKIFEDLVGKGAELEDKVSKAARNLAPEIMQKQRASVEDRMERMKTALGFATASADQSEQIDAIEARLKTIEAKLDHITEMLGKAPAKKAAPRRKPAARNSKSTK